MSEALPRTLGDYELLELLSQGALTDTYFGLRRAQGEGAGELVSLKLLLRFSDVAPERAVLMREAEMQGLCTHPGVVRVIDKGIITSEGAARECFIARPYVAGFAWSELVIERGALPLEIVVALADALLEVLAAVHQTGAADGRVLGLIHRDVTPSNILLGLDGTVHLTDFGLAHAPGAWGLLPDDEIAQGTPRYVTPEAARGEQPDERSDQFQLALTLLDLLGHKLRGGAVSLTSIVQEQLFDLPLWTSGELGVLGPLLARALVPEQARRFNSTALMLAALREQVPASAARGELLRDWLETELPTRVAAERARTSAALARV